MGISKGKISLVHVAKHQLNMSDDAYRSMLENTAGVDSAKDLNDDGFEHVMERFKEMGFRSDRAKRDFGERAGMASPKQLEMIVSMWKQYADDRSDTALNHWIENHFHVTNLRFMSSDVAGKAIVALKAMTKGNTGKVSK